MNKSNNKVFKIVSIFICLIIASVAYSASIVNSKHDLSWLHNQQELHRQSSKWNQYNEVCVYCHTPHNANANVTAPLWNRQVSNPSAYTLYDSPTMDNKPTTVSGVSLACLSCHDGTIAVDSIINPPNTGWSVSTYHEKMTTTSTEKSVSCAYCHGADGSSMDHTAAYLETDLSNDHPISMAYPTNQPTQFNAVASGKVGTLPLYSGKVECASCHNVHNPANLPFLRSSNSISALCTACHIK